MLVDDPVIIAANPYVNDPAGGVLLWGSDYWAGLGEDSNLYRPVTIFSYWLSARFSAEPWWQRLWNVVLHACAAWLVGLWCARWQRQPAGYLASALVLFHPLATDVIDRIVGRADILVLVGTAGFLWLQRRCAVEGWTLGRWWCAGALALVALGAKESGLILIPLAVLGLGTASYLMRPPSRRLVAARETATS